MSIERRKKETETEAIDGQKMLDYGEYLPDKANELTKVLIRRFSSQAQWIEKYKVRKCTPWFWCETDFRNSQNE